jgi:lysozyme
MKTSQRGIDLIKQFEGLELPWLTIAVPVYPTIGYGHTRDVSEGDTCTKDEAEQILISDLQEFEGYVNDLVKSLWTRINSTLW